MTILKVGPILRKPRRHAGDDEDIHLLTDLKGVRDLEVNAFQRASQVMLQMSTREGFGLSVTEALWKGIPVVGRSVGGIPLQIINGTNGFLVNSVTEAAEKTLYLLNHKEEANQMGNNGKEHVKNNFLIVDDFLLYKGAEVIGEGTGFGVPIVKYSDETVFSGSSSLRVRTLENIVEIRKEFIMDLVTRNTLRNFKLENPKIRTLLDCISTVYKKQYQSHVHFADLFLLARNLFFKFGVKSTFIKSTPKGAVVANIYYRSESNIGKTGSKLT